MEVRSVVAIARALQDEQVRYLVVGGLAVAIHGYVRNTADMALVLDMEPSNVERALHAFGRLGYRREGTGGTAR